MSQFSITAARPGVSTVSVDGIAITVGGAPVELTDDQIERVSAIKGVEIEPAGDAAKAAKAEAPTGALPSPSTPGGSSASTAKD